MFGFACRLQNVKSFNDQSYGSKVVLYKETKHCATIGEYHNNLQRNKQNVRVAKKKKNLEEGIIIHQKVYSNTLPVG